MTNATAVGIPVIEMRHRMAIALDYADIKKGRMAELLGVTGDTVGNYLSGRSRPLAPTLREWARITGVSIEWLRWGTTPVGGDDGTDGGSRVATLGEPSRLRLVPAANLLVAA